VGGGVRREEVEGMSRHTYTAVLVPEAEGGYSVEVPALSGCFTQGESLVEAIAMAEEAILLYLEFLIAKREPLPEEMEELSVHIGDAREAMLRKVTVTVEEGAAVVQASDAPCLQALA